MTNFYRAIREAWHYWPTLSLGILCSFVMALLWGANIIALFPVIETTIHGGNLQSWNEKRIVTVREKVVALKAEYEALEAVPGADEVNLKMQLKKDYLRTKIMAEEFNLSSLERLQPWLNAWLPSEPFQTVVLVLTLVVFGTLLKQIFSLANIVLVNYVSQSIAREVRMRIFGKAVTMDRHGFKAVGISGFTAFITQTTDGLAQGITAVYGGLIAEPLRIISCIVLALMVSWRVTLASMIFAPVMVVLMVWLNRKIRGLAKQVLDRSFGFHHVILEVFSALGTVQSNTMEEFERERFRQSTKQMRRMGVIWSFYHALANPITEIFGIAALCSGHMFSESG